jgi:hypothetical protein
VGANVTLEWTVTSEAGETNTGFNLAGPDDSTFYSGCTSPALLSGTIHHGRWQSVCTIPNGVANGTWTPEFFAQDGLGQQGNADGPTFTVT